MEVHGPRDGDGLPLAARQRADRRRHRDVLGNADALEQRGRHLLHLGLIHLTEEARPLDRLAAEEQVAGDGKLRHERRILVDRLDAVGDGVGRATHVDLLAPDVDITAGGAHGPGQHLDERRLAGAVVAEQADDLVLEDTEGDAVEGAHAAVIAADIVHQDEFFGHCLNSLTGAGARDRNAAPSCRG